MQLATASSYSSVKSLTIERIITLSSLASICCTSPIPMDPGPSLADDFIQGFRSFCMS
jgi:hypothetical protein